MHSVWRDRRLVARHKKHVEVSLHIPPTEDVGWVVETCGALGIGLELVEGG